MLFSQGHEMCFLFIQCKPNFAEIKVNKPLAFMYIYGITICTTCFCPPKNRVIFDDPLAAIFLIRYFTTRQILT